MEGGEDGTKREVGRPEGKEVWQDTPKEGRREESQTTLSASKF
jgi:hypothetical protein